MIKRTVIAVLFIMQITNLAFAFNESNLDSIEYSKYGRIYSNEELSSRLKRLEIDTFGMSQSGNIENRIGNLTRMSSSNNYVNTFQPYENFYMPEKKGIIKRFFDNISSSFTSPSITGYTPSFNQGYAKNMYRNEYMNFLNNGNNYCPLNGGYRPYNHQRFHNHYYNGYNNNFNSGRNLSHVPPRPYRYNPYYNPYSSPNNAIPTNSYSNVATKSTVHILQD